MATHSSHRARIMTLQDLRSDWRHVKRSAQVRWDRLTAADLDEVEDSADKALLRGLEERYGRTRQILAGTGRHPIQRH